nr:YicC family protein [bacterium]
MTGYGRHSAMIDGREMTVELKSVNHRYLDISMRMPRNLGLLEEGIRRALSQRLSRGHIDVFLNYRNLREDAREVRVDEALAKLYAGALSRLSEQLAVPMDSADAAFYAKLPDVFSVQEREEDAAALSDLLQAAIGPAIDQLIAMRGHEGQRLKADMLSRIDTMEGMVAKVAERSPEVVEAYRQKLAARIEEMLDRSMPEDRLAVEVALFADRSCIDEEIVRLRAHFAQFRHLADMVEPQGRKLDFLIQEMNRETNTIGSKASDAGLVALVVDLKAEIEKLREQAQNIE